MLPVVKGFRETRKQILLYTIALIPVSLAPWFLGEAGRVYGASAGVLGLGFLAYAWRVWRDQADEAGHSAQNDKPARDAFRFSLAYLALMFVAFAVDAWVRRL